MKNLVAVLVSVLIANEVFAFLPNEKVLKAFKETFTQVENAKWEDHDSYFTVSFKSGPTQSKVFYNAEGGMLGSIRYYDPALLPLHILNRLKSQNKTKKMFSVTEVTYEAVITWFIKMEDVYSWYTFKVEEDGTNTLVEKYEKG